jgi:hypothetical protein
MCHWPQRRCLGPEAAAPLPPTLRASSAWQSIAGQKRIKWDKTLRRKCAPFCRLRVLASLKWLLVEQFSARAEASAWRAASLRRALARLKPDLARCETCLWSRAATGGRRRRSLRIQSPRAVGVVASKAARPVPRLVRERLCGAHVDGASSRPDLPGAPYCQLSERTCWTLMKCEGVLACCLRFDTLQSPCTATQSVNLLLRHTAIVVRERL